MKSIILVAAIILSVLALAAPQAWGADIDQYVDEQNGFILLTIRCTDRNRNPCNCAILSEELVDEDEDPFVCWNIEGEKIIFTNERRRIEKRLDEIKSRVNTPSPSTSPRRENPTSSDRLSDRLS
jgi:hypothetical protein